MSTPDPRTAAAAARPSFDRITAALDAFAAANGRKPGPASSYGEWTKYRCPSHDDHNPSLGLIYDAEKSRTTVRCFTGECTDEEVLHAIGLSVRDLFDAPRRGFRHRSPQAGQARQGGQRPNRQQGPDREGGNVVAFQSRRDRLGKVTGPRREAAIYAYTDERGNPLGEVVRVHIPHEHGIEKLFRQRKCDAGGRWSGGGFAPVLYQLPAVREAVADGETIWLVEGEKDADRGRGAGLVTTCNAMGAGSFRPEHAHQLRGAARVVIVADKDGPGYRHAARVAQMLTGRVGELLVVEAATGKDLSDHIDAGHGVELDEFIRVDASVLAGALSAPPAGHLHQTQRSPEPPQPQRSAPEAEPEHNPDYEHEPPPDPADDDINPFEEETPVSEHAADIDHAARDMAVFTRMLLTMMTQWAQAAALRRQRSLEFAARQAAAEAELAQKRHEAERKAMHASLDGVGSDNWWKIASADDVVEAWYEATSWSAHDAKAEQVRQTLAAGLRDRWNVDVDELSRGADPDAVERMVHNAYSDGASLDRARLAQKYAINATAEIPNLNDDQRKAVYAAIEEYTHAAAKSLGMRRSSTPPAPGVEATQEAARARVRFLLAEADQAAQDKVLFALDYLTTDPRAAIGEANWGADSDTRAKMDVALSEYQARLARGADTSQIVAELTRLVAELPEADRDTARARGKAIKAAPGQEFPPLWPGAVDKDALGQKIADYVQAARSQMEADQAKAAKLREEIEAAARAKGSGLAPIERDAIKLALADAAAPGIGPEPKTVWADKESAYRIRRTEARQEAQRRAEETRAAVVAALAAAGHQVEDGQAQKYEPVWNAINRLTRDTTSAFVNGEVQPDALVSHRRALSDALDQVGVTDREARQQITAVTTRLETESVAAAATVRRQKSEQAKSRADVPEWDSQSRREQLVEELAALGVDRESATALLLTDLAQARPGGAATAPGEAPKARRTAQGAGVNLGRKRGQGRS
ncbi:hypothetical protein [Nocardia amamiensis]|uniref:hypothetical protein n=1 Tax=Nocardia amamiensis TaxID=404578 RepID=UPI00082F8017|nr:hypothetical protein [Nocardia amamiensis]